MNGRPVTKEEISRIKALRKKGYSLHEIKDATGRGIATISRYIQNVSIDARYKPIWQAKQGASKERSAKEWEAVRNEVRKLMFHLTRREKILIASCLYWGEGTKQDFSLSNTDPSLIFTFVQCLKELGITKNDLRITVRIYEDIDRNKAVKYWAKIIGIPQRSIRNVNLVKGKKHGKLQYGMCRVRVIKGGRHLKFIKSVIESIRNLSAIPS